MRNATLSEILQEARREGLFELLDQMTYQVTTNGRTAILHLRDGTGPACGGRITSGGGSISLTRLRSRKGRCPRCMDRLSRPPTRAPFSPSWETLNMIGYVMTEQRVLADLITEPASRGTAHRAALIYRDIQSIRRSLRSWKGNLSGTELDSQPFTDYIARTTEVLLGQFVEYLQSAGVRDALEQSMLTLATRTSDVNVYSGDRLVVWDKPLLLLTLTDMYPSDVSAAVLAWGAYQHESDRTMVVVPGPVAAWVEKASQRSSSFRSTAHVAPVVQDDRVLDTALGLWTPYREGPLAPFAGAVAVAQSIGV